MNNLELLKSICNKIDRIDSKLDMIIDSKRRQEENHGTEIVINGATDVKAEDLAKAMMKNFNKSSYR